MRLGYGVEPAYFSQHEIELDERGSVLDCVQRATGLQRPQAQSLLGRFLFSGWQEHDKPVVALSGGERRRLALAIVVASGANLLILDEPTNHLDLESREALEAALEAFPGTVLLVSHDRALLDAVAHRTLAIENGSLASYEGGWAELIRRREEREKAAEPPPKKPSRSRRRSRRSRSPRARARSRRSRPRSRARRRPSPSSSGGWPRTGGTWSSSPRIARPAPSSRTCSPAGSSSSSARARSTVARAGGQDVHRDPRSGDGDRRGHGARLSGAGVGRELEAAARAPRSRQLPTGARNGS